MTVKTLIRHLPVFILQYQMSSVRKLGLLQTAHRNTLGVKLCPRKYKTWIYNTFEVNAVKVEHNKIWIGTLPGLCLAKYGYSQSQTRTNFSTHCLTSTLHSTVLNKGIILGIIMHVG